MTREPPPGERARKMKYDYITIYLYITLGQ